MNCNKMFYTTALLDSIWSEGFYVHLFIYLFLRAALRVIGDCYSIVTGNIRGRTFQIV